MSFVGDLAFDDQRTLEQDTNSVAEYQASRDALTEYSRGRSLWG